MRLPPSPFLHQGSWARRDAGPQSDAVRKVATRPVQLTSKRPHRRRAGENWGASPCWAIERERYPQQRRSQRDPTGCDPHLASRREASAETTARRAQAACMRPGLDACLGSGYGEARGSVQVTNLPPLSWCHLAKSPPCGATSRDDWNQPGQRAGGNRIRVSWSVLPAARELAPQRSTPIRKWPGVFFLVQRRVVESHMQSPPRV